MVFSVTTLLHDFCPLVQGLLFVCKHDGGFLFQTEIASSWFLAVDRGLLDDSPLDVELDPPSLEFPDLGWQRSVLQCFVPLVRGVERIVPLVGEGPAMVVVSLPQFVTCQILDIIKDTSYRPEDIRKDCRNIAIIICLILFMQLLCQAY